MMAPRTVDSRLLTTLVLSVTTFHLLHGGLALAQQDDIFSSGRGDAPALDLGSLLSKARPRVPRFSRPGSLEKIAKRDDSIEEDPNGQSYLWTLEDTYAGRTFFDEMKFWSNEDPTHGNVQYVPRERAFSQNYTYFEDDGTVVMQSDMKTHLPLGQFRESVRIETLKKFDGGLFILDLKRAPWGCAIWPAYWTTAAIPDWPRLGEIDILEGTHDNMHNQITWHTSEGCSLDVSAEFTGTPEHEHVENGVVSCKKNETKGLWGCGVVEWSRASYGAFFEEQGGGVLAMKWDEFGISVWSFFRAAIPQDVTAGTPTPSTWGPPSAMLSPSHCNITHHFREHVVIFDITFCGDLAGNNYAESDCPGTCHERIADPANFVNATWHINSLKVYQKLPIHARIDSGSAKAFSAEGGRLWFSLLAFVFITLGFSVS